MTASISGGDNGNMGMLPWLPFHNRLMKLSNCWWSTAKMIDLNVILVSLYFVKGKSYEHSLIIY